MESSTNKVSENEFRLFKLPQDTSHDPESKLSMNKREVLQPFSPNISHDPFIDESSMGHSSKGLKISSPFNKNTVIPHKEEKKVKRTNITEIASILNPINTTTTPTTPIISTSISNSEVKEKKSAEQAKPTTDESDIPIEILEEMNRIQETFEDIDKKYKLIDKIGEGTFSSVYKAEDVRGTARYLMGDSIWSSPELKRYNKRQKKNRKVYVALKRIYVTSSPQRISNELTLLYMLSGSSRVAPLLEALRHEDQIIAVLPYYPHADFREFFRDLPIEGIKIYMFELFQALNFVHSKGVIHRDIKPTNFLYDPFKKRGVLVDFGLAEQENLKPSTDPKSASFCPCSVKINITVEDPIRGYPKNDDRQGRRANRAGTRGFRAPEVLFKCPYQTTKIDIWSAGVILLTLLSRRFPFFNSRDDTDALVELTTIFGLKEMQECGALHGLGIETTLNTLGKKTPLTELIYKALYLEKQNSTLPSDSVALDTLKVFDSKYRINLRETDSDEAFENKKNHKEAFEVMDHCFKLDHKKRSTAQTILRLPFFTSINLDDDGEILVDGKP